MDSSRGNSSCNRKQCAKLATKIWGIRNEDMMKVRLFMIVFKNYSRLGACMHTANHPEGDTPRDQNEDNEQWIDSIPSLRERKIEAGRKQWKHLKKGAIEPHSERTKSRTTKRKAERDLHKKRAINEAKEIYRRNVISRKRGQSTIRD